MKKILITGSSGFIGRNLKEQLANRYSVFAPSRSELDLLDEDKVCDYIKKYRFDAIIHCAAENATRNSKGDAAKVLYHNCKLFFNLARCGDYCGKMIYYGSGAEYDKRYYVPKMSEDYFDTYVPADDYGFSKYIMAKYAEHSRNIYDLRLFGVFGKYEDWEIRFISNACSKAVMNLPITIKQNVLFDYLFIDDLVKITELFIENDPKEKFYNVCTGKSHDLLTLAGKVLTIAGKELDIKISSEGLGKEYSGDNSKLRKEFSGIKFTPIDDAIGELYNWYAENKHLLDKKLLLKDK